MINSRKNQIGVCVLVALISAGLAAIVVSQPPQRRGQAGRGPGGRPGGREADQARLKAPYVGVVTSQGIQKDLFPIQSTGVSTESIVKSASDFLASLSPEQLGRTRYPVDDIEWRQWDNRHFYKRQGVGFDEMTPKQRSAAFAMLSSSLSAKGLKKTQDIMKLNGTLAELCDNFEEYGEWLYWITVMGEPSATEPWGWQLDGHHAIINYFVLGDQVVMSPVFLGSEPVEAKAGKFKGTIVMQDEQDKGLALITALSDEQQSQAILMRDKQGTHNLSEAYKDNIELDYAGIAAANFDGSQKDILLELIGEYVGNMRPGHAEVRMEEVRQHLDQTYFAWIGGTSSDSVYYYRVHSPGVLIEFDHQRRVAPTRTREATREHIHTVVRTPNGNDYGKDLLRQHYQQHPHDH